MKKRELCSFGKKINHRLIALEQSKGWLIEEVKRHTGLYFDRSYLRKIETGQLATPKIGVGCGGIFGGAGWGVF